MSTTKDRGDFVFQCDAPGCGATLATLTSNFDSARNVLRRERWRPVRVSGTEWQHLCAVCVRAGVRLPREAA